MQISIFSPIFNNERFEYEYTTKMAVTEKCGGEYYF